MVKQPLFGQDSSPHITSMLLSAIFTLVAWIIFCVMCLVVKFKPQTPEYKEVQIVLSSTPIADPEPVEGLVEEATAAAEDSVVPEPAVAEQAAVAEQTAVAEPVEAPEIPKPVEAPKSTPAPAKAQTQPKTQTQPKPATKETPADKKVSDQIYKSVEELMEEQMSTKKTSSVPDWWNDDNTTTTETPTVSQKVDKVTNTSSISGSAASTSNPDQRQASSSSSSSSSTKSTPAASSSTSSAAAAIKKTTGSTSSSSSSSASSSSSQKFSSDLDINWNGGVTRKQIGSLSIDLKESGSDIKEKKTTVTIEFTVDEKGYTIAGTIKITPESILPEKVRKEVISEISKWRFNEAPNRSVATFEYTIVKN